MPTVSIIVATHRRDSVLQRALESLVCQTYRDYEIILVDDNDDAEWNLKVEHIVNDFRERHPSISLTYIRNRQKLGSAESRNCGIDASNGKYITFLDDDDIYMPEKVLRQYEFMEEALLDYSVTGIDLYYDDGKLSERRRHSNIRSTDADSLMKYHMMYHITGADTIMFKKEYIDTIGKFPSIDVGDEFYLMERAILGGGKFGYLDRCDIKAFVHVGEGGLSSGQRKIDGENRLFEHKKTYFSHFDKKSIRYIKVRHWAVLAFAYVRMRRYFCFFKCGVRSFLSAPVMCLRLVLEKKVRIC